MASGIPITNDIQLMAIFSAEMTAIVDELTDWLLNQVRMSIDTNVYSKYSQSPNYDRLGMEGGFIGAWEKEVATFAGKYINSKVDMNPLAMVLNAEKHQHGNLAGEDRRENMAEIIESGTEWDIGGAARIPRDFWSPIEQMVTDGSLDVVLENLFGKHGIQFTKTF